MSGSSKQNYIARAGALAGIDRTLAEFGVDPEPLLARHGLSREMLNEGDRLIALEQAAALLEHAARESACPHFALELAARQDANLLGAIGLLMQTADTVREALKDVEQYLRMVHVSHMHWTLVKRGEYDAFELTADLATLTPQQARLVLEFAVAQCYRVLDSVSRGRLELSCICFRQGDPRSLPALKRSMNVPVNLSADFDGLLFAPGAIDLSIPQADSGFHESVRRLIVAQQSKLSEESLAEQVKVFIRPLLPTGQCSLERIARCFACDKRTLQRYLRENFDTSYQQLLDDVRFETACYYLRESSLPMIQVAQLAGFSEPTNFSRAFRRRLGFSPREWRRLHGDVSQVRSIAAQRR